MKIEGVDGGAVERKRPPKRKKVELCYTPTPEEKQAKIVGFRQEIDSLVKYCKKLVSENREAFLGSFENLQDNSTSLNGVIACLMEESNLPLSKLVDEILEKVKGRTGNGKGFSKASVRNGVLMIGQRQCYGVVGAEADVLEDEDDSALWSWETRDLKLIPKPAHASLKAIRTFQSKIQERITAVSEMINALEKSENHPNCDKELMKASEKLGKVLNEAEIRLSMENMLHIGAETAEKEAERGEILLSKPIEKNQREKDRELNKLVRELQMQKRLKRQEETAEKDQRRREKEEAESRKQLALQQKRLKRQEETAEKDQKRREKEEAESRKQLALQKQASLMERFLKRNKTSSSLENDSSANKAIMSGPSSNMLERNSESVTISMDTALSQNDGIEVEDIWKSHLNGWHSTRYSNQRRQRHWGIRRKPKTELFKELKLITNREQTFHEDPHVEKLMIGFDEADDGIDSSPHQCGSKRVPVKLLQFDKSHRPAFYGVWPKNSQVVGPRHPFAKDSDINYEIDSDEEWTEDEPGESLSDFDKDDEDESMGEEDDSQDGFFVPDGYLSEDEGVKLDDELDSKATSEQQLQHNEMYTDLLRQQKYLSSLTEHALKKNKPLIVLNLTHEKSAVSSTEEAAGRLKLERLALQALGMCCFPCLPLIEISVPKLA